MASNWEAVSKLLIGACHDENRATLKTDKNAESHLFCRELIAECQNNLKSLVYPSLLTTTASSFPMQCRMGDITRHRYQHSLSNRLPLKKEVAAKNETAADTSRAHISDHNIAFR